MASPIRIDNSVSGIVIHCALCGHWAAFKFNLDEAWECAESHEQRVHPQLHDHRRARNKRESRARHAD